MKLKNFIIIVCLIYDFHVYFLVNWEKGDKQCGGRKCMYERWLYVELSAYDSVHEESFDCSHKEQLFQCFEN